jgi:uncharacterized protein (TIGR00255 family)
MNPKQTVPTIGPGIASMTGYGRSEKEFKGLRISTEIRSVNNRHCEIGMKTPRELNPIESDIRERIRKRLTRGRISLLIALERDASDEPLVMIDPEAANACYSALVELNQRIGCSGDVTLAHLLHFSDVFVKQADRVLNEELRARVLEALDAALADLIEMRRTEGISLGEDLIERVQQVEKIRKKIVALADSQPEQQLAKLVGRIEQLKNAGPLDPGRLEQEMAFLADRLDISEECVRLESHNQRFLETIAGEEPAGKRLGFLLQEMNREANTISSKSASVEISHLAVSLKEEIERAREQVQNLE